MKLLLDREAALEHDPQNMTQPQLDFMENIFFYKMNSQFSRGYYRATVPGPPVIPNNLFADLLRLGIIENTGAEIAIA